MKKKNICIVSECQQIPGVGGIETVSFILREELLKNGYYVWSMYFIPKSTPTIYDIQFKQVHDICSNENKEQFIEIIEKHHIDFILLQGAPIDGLLELCIETKKATGIKLIYTYHFNPLMCIGEFDDYKEKALKDCNHIITPLYSLYLASKRSIFIKKSLEKFKNYDISNIDAFVSVNCKHTTFFQTLYPKEFKDRFHTIANPIALGYEDESTTEKENIILFVSRLTYQKRLDRLIHIWNSLYKDHPTWKLVVVGDGDYTNEYKKIATDLDLKNIEFVGQQPAEEYFKKSKIVCMTSSHEAFGMVLVEAQKYGCVPITYSNFETASEIIQDGYNGLLIEPFKQKKYEEALSRLLTDNNYLQMLKGHGRSYIEKFNVKTIIKEWIKLLNSL